MTKPQDVSGFRVKPAYTCRDALSEIDERCYIWRIVARCEFSDLACEVFAAATIQRPASGTAKLVETRYRRPNVAAPSKPLARREFSGPACGTFATARE